MDPEFKKAFLAAYNAGPEALAEFLFETFAFDGHTHQADQIFTDATETTTLDEVLEEDDDKEEGDED